MRYSDRQRGQKIYDYAVRLQEYIRKNNIGKDTADDGFCNEELHLTKDRLLANIRRVQSARNLHRSDTLSAPLGACALDVEMETGTGKTYVYIKTMFELNRRYGWSKFIVVVPSIPIREGARKSFEMTAEHFMEHYGRKGRFTDK